MLYVNEDENFEEAANALDHYLWHKKSANEWLSALRKRSHFNHDEDEVDTVLKAIGKAMIGLPYKNPIIFDSIVFTIFIDKEDSFIRNVIVTTTTGDFIGQFRCATIESLASEFDSSHILNDVFGISQGLFVMTAKYLAIYTAEFDI